MFEKSDTDLSTKGPANDVFAYFLFLNQPKTGYSEEDIAEVALDFRDIHNNYSEDRLGYPITSATDCLYNFANHIATKEKGYFEDGWITRENLVNSGDIESWNDGETVEIGNKFIWDGIVMLPTDDDFYDATSITLFSRNNNFGDFYLVPRNDLPKMIEEGSEPEKARDKLKRFIEDEEVFELYFDWIKYGAEVEPAVELLLELDSNLKTYISGSSYRELERGRFRNLQIKAFRETFFNEDSNFLKNYRRANPDFEGDTLEDIDLEEWGSDAFDSALMVHESWRFDIESEIDIRNLPGLETQKMESMPKT